MVLTFLFGHMRSFSARRKRCSLQWLMQMLNGFQKSMESKGSCCYLTSRHWNSQLLSPMASCTSSTRMFSKIWLLFGLDSLKVLTKVLAPMSSCPKYGRPLGQRLQLQGQVSLVLLEQDHEMLLMIKQLVWRICGHFGCYTSDQYCSIRGSRGGYTMIISLSWWNWSICACNLKSQRLRFLSFETGFSDGLNNTKSEYFSIIFVLLLIPLLGYTTSIHQIISLLVHSQFMHSST